MKCLMIVNSGSKVISGKVIRKCFSLAHLCILINGL